MVSTEDWRISWCGKLHIFGVRCVECMEKQSFSFSHRGDSWRGLDSDMGSTSPARAASLPPGFPPSSHPSHQDLVFPSGVCKLKNRAELFGTGRPSFACRVFGRGRAREGEEVGSRQRERTLNKTTGASAGCHSMIPHDGFRRMMPPHSFTCGGFAWVWDGADRAECGYLQTREEGAKAA